MSSLGSGHPGDHRYCESLFGEKKSVQVPEEWDNQSGDPDSDLMQFICYFDFLQQSEQTWSVGGRASEGSIKEQNND